MPFRVFACCCSPQGVSTASASSSGIGFSFRVPRPRPYRRIGWTIPLRRWPLPRPCGLPPAAGASHRADNWRRPLFEFSLPLESLPATPSRMAAACRHLSWALAPFSTSGIEGPLRRGLCLPAAFRLQGLATLLTASSIEPLPVLFRTGSAPGIHPSELSPLPGSPRVTTRKHPPTVPLAVNLLAEAKNRPDEPRFLGFDPWQSPWRFARC
jgi:hypothetical protein